MILIDKGVIQGWEIPSQFFFYLRIFFFFWLLICRGPDNKPEYCVRVKLGRVKTEQFEYYVYETHNRDS